jgi:hypothetical protein
MRVLVASLAVILILAERPTIEDAVQRTGDMVIATTDRQQRWTEGKARRGSLPQPDTTAVFVLVGFAVAVRAVWHARRPRDIEYRRSWRERRSRIS